MINKKKSTRTLEEKIRCKGKMSKQCKETMKDKNMQRKDKKIVQMNDGRQKYAKER